jgi:hypothetical protein
MINRKKDDVLEQAIAARRARILKLLVKRTLCLLNPDDGARAAALATFDAALDAEMGPHGHPGP